MKQPSDDLGGSMIELWNTVARVVHQISDSGVVCPQKALDEFTKWIRIDHLHSQGDSDDMIALKLNLCDGRYVGKLRRAYEQCPPSRGLSKMLMSADGNAFAYQLAVGFGLGKMFSFDSATQFFQDKLGKNCGITRDNIDIIVRDAKKRGMVKRVKGGNFQVISDKFCHEKPHSQVMFDMRLQRAQRTIANRHKANVSFSAYVSLTKHGFRKMEEWLEPSNGKNPSVSRWHNRTKETEDRRGEGTHNVNGDTYGMLIGLTPGNPGMSLPDALLDLLGAKVNGSNVVIPGTGAFDDTAISAFVADANTVIWKEFQDQLTAAEGIGQGDRSNYMFVFMAAPWHVASNVENKQ